MRNRYTAQASQYSGFDNKRYGYYRVYDSVKRAMVLEETVEELPRDQSWEDFNPVEWFYDKGWDIETPYPNWSLLDDKGRVTNDVHSFYEAQVFQSDTPGRDFKKTSFKGE